MQYVMFLCTGNYFRSRFCEAFFNHHANVNHLHWQAFSRGLAPNINTLRNPGPISVYTKKYLQQLNILEQSTDQYPVSVSTKDWHSAQTVIAVYKKEHQPMVLCYWPEMEKNIIYWDVPGIDEAVP